MRIIPKSPGVQTPEHAYRRQDQQPVKNETQNRQNVPAPEVKKTVTADGKPMTAETVLSKKEMDAIKLLFNFDQKHNSTLYGRNRIQNVQSGVLLDIKG